MVNINTSIMKRIILNSGLVLALLFGVTSNVFGQTKNFIDQPYIEVNGYADTLVTPNEIYIQIVIAESDSKGKISVEEQEGKMITALKSLNINTDVDLKLSDMLSNYKFYLLKSKDVMKTKEYVLKVSDAKMASRVLLKLENIGISNTSIQRVDHSQRESILNECRTKAVKNAYSKAVALTRPLSQEVGRALYISDNNSGYDYRLQNASYGLMMSRKSMAESDYVAPNIDFEKIRITSTVDVKFVLK